MVYSAFLGGPSYRMECDVRHAGAMAELAITLYARGFQGVEFQYQHGCPVELPRNKLFKRALGSGATHLFWADSDVYWDSSENLVWAAAELDRLHSPMVAVPVRQRNGQCNVLLSDKLDRFSGTLEVGRKLRRCYAVGTALCVFYLPWYRQHWPVGPHFRTDWVVRGEAGKPEFFSEDFWHCLQLQRIAESPFYFAPLTVTHHAARGGEGDNA